MPQSSDDNRPDCEYIAMDEDTNSARNDQKKIRSSARAISFHIFWLASSSSSTWKIEILLDVDFLSCLNVCGNCFSIFSSSTSFLPALSSLFSAATLEFIITEEPGTSSRRVLRLKQEQPSLLIAENQKIGLVKRHPSYST